MLVQTKFSLTVNIVMAIIVYREKNYLPRTINSSSKIQLVSRKVDVTRQWVDLFIPFFRTATADG